MAGIPVGHRQELHRMTLRREFDRRPAEPVLTIVGVRPDN
jgi:hypothetical protein